MKSVKEDITQYNDKGQPHGLWESYFSTGKLYYKCTYNNGELVGYEEYYDYFRDNKLTKNYHL